MRHRTPVAVPAGPDIEERGRGLRGFVLVALGAVLWGTGGLTGAALAESTGASMLAVATVRLLVGGGLLLLGLAVGGRLRLRGLGRSGWRRIALTGVLAAVYQSSYFVAVSLAGVAVATLVALGAAPVIAAAATAVVHRRRPPLRVITAVLLALVGLALLIGVTTGTTSSALGTGLALVAASGFATMTLVNRRSLDGVGPLTLTGTAFTGGGLLLIPVALAVGGLPTVTGPQAGHAWLLLLYLGLGPTALAYGAYFAGLRTVPATTATLLALLEPLTATVGAAVLLGEVLTAWDLVGGVVLVAAVVMLRPGSPTMDPGLR